MAKIAVILSGCGYLDGSEVHEAVLTLLALAQAKHTYQCFAPDIPQYKVVNHLTGREEPEERNALIEAARIARGEISPLSELNIEKFDAIMLPGGFGAALNLSTFAIDKEECTVDEHLKKAVLAAHGEGKPIGATCISPAPLAKIFQGVAPVQMTLGSDPAMVSQLEEMGMQPKTATVSEMVADEEHKVYTTPCYMEPPDLAAMFEGIKKIVEKLGG